MTGFSEAAWQHTTALRAAIGRLPFITELTPGGLARGRLRRGGAADDGDRRRRRRRGHTGGARPDARRLYPRQPVRMAVLGRRLPAARLAELRLIWRSGPDLFPPVYGRNLQARPNPAFL